MMEFRGAVFRTNGPPIADGDLEFLEKTIGNRLPEDYRAFLLTINGGELRDDLGVPVLDPRLGDDIAGVGDLYNITAGNPWSVFSHAEDFNYHLRTPRHVFPFGQNGCEQRLSMSLGSGDYGHIYLWDSNDLELWIDEEECQQDYSELYKLANSFTDFWDALRPVPPMY